MTKKSLTKSSRGATATGATAIGAASFGAMALGAAAVGALAIGRLSVGRARLRRVEIDELIVGRIEFRADGASGPAAVARIAAAPGKGDALERFLRHHRAGSEPGAPPFRAHRSRSDPDMFLFLEPHADEAAFDRHAQALVLDALLRLAAEAELLASPAGDGLALEIYHVI